jgi:hypothetical protein
MYYNPASGWDHVSADVFVTFGVERRERDAYKTWEEGGKFADVVFEISSPSTIMEDLGKKMRLYARLGVGEYYLYDPQHQVQPYIQAFRLVDGAYVPTLPLANGGYYSELLGTELRVIGRWLRVIDPATGAPIPVPDELDELLHEEAQARQQAEDALREALAELARLRDTSHDR